MRTNDRIQKLKWREPVERFDRDVQLESALEWNPNRVLAVGWIVVVLVALPFGVDHPMSLEGLGFVLLGLGLGVALFLLPAEKEPSYDSVVEIDGDGIFVRGDSGFWCSRFEDLAGYVILNKGTHRTLVLYLSPTHTHMIGVSRQVSDRELAKVLSQAGVQCLSAGWRNPRRTPATA